MPQIYWHAMLITAGLVQLHKNYILLEINNDKQQRVHVVLRFRVLSHTKKFLFFNVFTRFQRREQIYRPRLQDDLNMLAQKHLEYVINYLNYLNYYA